jgi:hypothetical protein
MTEQAHEPLPFNTADPMAMKWTERALELLNGGQLSAQVISHGSVVVVQVDGSCPYCDDHIHCTEQLTAVTEGTEGVARRTGGYAAPAPATGYKDVTVTCGCNEAHAGDPKKGTGCGTSFRIRVSVGT